MGRLKLGLLPDPSPSPGPSNHAGADAPSSKGTVGLQAAQVRRWGWGIREGKDSLEVGCQDSWVLTLSEAGT